MVVQEQKPNQLMVVQAKNRQKRIVTQAALEKRNKYFRIIVFGKAVCRIDKRPSFF